MENTRNTRQKRIIMEALAAADHPTAGELYEIIRKDNPSLSRGTVFRVLSQFADDGEILKLQFLDSPARFDATTTPHAHACCERCGKVYDVFLKGRDLNARLPEGFTVHSVQIELSGICQNCSLNS